MLGQRRRRCAGVVQMLYKCFGFAGLCPSNYLTRDVDPMVSQCWASVADGWANIGSISRV